MRGLEFSGSLLNVILSDFKNMFMPVKRLCGVVARVFLDGVPSKTITLSAKYVAIIKSCSTTNAVFLQLRMYLKTFFLYINKS